ncbi:MAG: glycerophosphodiester phosphodiesterase [Gemmatimonadota bacterium]|nr:glycerophosphodiester phosphodiesterase [Gemmatimonadota bacterium]
MLGLLVLTILVMYLTTAPMPPHPFTNTVDLLVIAHRGGRGQWPESTMYAFQKAHDLGVDVLEMDIQATSDGFLVVMHDQTVDRTTDGQGRVSDLTLAEIQQLDAGYNWTDDAGKTYPYRGQGITVPTFRSVVEAFQDTRMVVELKQTKQSIADRFLKILQEFDTVDHTLVASFTGDTINEVREVYPGIASFKPGDAMIFTALNLVRLSGAFQSTSQAFEIPAHMGGMNIVDERYIRNAHKHNVKVHVWTINDVKEMQHLIDVGVDGIMTDYPIRLMRLLGRVDDSNITMEVDMAN